MISRRSLFTGLGAVGVALAAPAVIRTAGVLMPIKAFKPGAPLMAAPGYAIWAAGEEISCGDGIMTVEQGGQRLAYRANTALLLDMEPFPTCKFAGIAVTPANVGDVVMIQTEGPVRVRFSTV